MINKELFSYFLQVLPIILLTAIGLVIKWYWNWKTYSHQKLNLLKSLSHCSSIPEDLQYLCKQKCIEMGLNCLGIPKMLTIKEIKVLKQLSKNYALKPTETRLAARMLKLKGKTFKFSILVSGRKFNYF